MAGLAALPLAGAALPALALNTTQARDLVGLLVGEINAVIAARLPAQQMYGEFERIFLIYADVPTIARATLGADARRASASQLSAFTREFQRYISVKYGSRFNEFVGGEIVVRDARPLKSFFEVLCTADLANEAPFEISFMVSDRSGKDLFFDLLIEGISLLKSERSEIGAMLDQRRGDIDALIRDLNTA